MSRKNLLPGVAYIVLLLLSGYTPQVLAEERILAFFSEVTVHRDGSMIVTESISVKSEQGRIKRGIYRDFPTRYKTSFGTVNVEFGVLSVQYMEVAEKNRLNILNPPEYTPRHFEELLPYALALGVDQQWAEQFSGHLARHGYGESAYRPSWYRGRRWNDFNAAGFSSSLGASLSSAISASSTAPGSSSGSGGGSSGGGGGGGGGGGW